VLKKPGRLTDSEFAQIKKHCELGAELLRGKEFPWDVKPAILYHHEKLDGSGYPLGLKGEDIPLPARIICIADVFDALTSDRIYRSAYDTAGALKIMSDDSGRAFDPVLLKCFVNLVNQGVADPVINSRTRDDELFDIWSQCMGDDKPGIDTVREKVAG
jgi:HD-GYP domain-containing protein (c-di-GMP phosphodiesterase class II)